MVIAGTIAAAICLLIALAVFAIAVWAVAAAIDFVARLGGRQEETGSEPRPA